MPFLRHDVTQICRLRGVDRYEQRWEVPTVFVASAKSTRWQACSGCNTERGLCLPLNADSKHLHEAVTEHAIPADGLAPSHHCLCVSRCCSTRSVTLLCLWGLMEFWLLELLRQSLRHRNAVRVKIKPSSFILHPATEVVINTVRAGCCSPTV